MVKVLEPTRDNEFSVHAELFVGLRKLGLNVYGEVKVMMPRKDRRPETCRFDIAEFNQGALRGLIEVKADVVVHQTERGWLGTRQGDRYSMFGVPIVLIYGATYARDFLADAAAKGSIDWKTWRVC